MDIQHALQPNTAVHANTGRKRSAASIAKQKRTMAAKRKKPTKRSSQKRKTAKRKPRAQSIPLHAIPSRPVPVRKPRAAAGAVNAQKMKVVRVLLHTALEMLGGAP